MKYLFVLQIHIIILKTPVSLNINDRKIRWDT